MDAPGGTPWYMPPESVECLPSVRPNNACNGMTPSEFGADWWAWGILLYWAVFNRHPFCIGCSLDEIEGELPYRAGESKYPWILRNVLTEGWLEVAGAITANPTAITDNNGPI